MIKVASSASNSTTQVLFLKTAIIFGVQQKYFMCASFTTKNNKKMYSQGLRFNKILFTDSLRMFLSRTGFIFNFFFYCGYTGSEEYNMVWCSCFGLCLSASSFTHHCFCTITANVTTVKKVNSVLILLQKVLTSGTPRGSQSPLEI